MLKRHALLVVLVPLIAVPAVIAIPPGQASKPSDLQAIPVSPTRIELSWGEATNNVGVSMYVVQRAQGGTFSTIGTVNTPTTTFSDTTVSASTAYQYRVRACNTASDCGGFSVTVEVTTPSGGGGGGTLVFSDGFETGFSWNVVKPDITRQSAEVHAGSFGVRATGTSAGGAAFARTAIGSTMQDVYYRTYFKVISKDANDVILMRVLDPVNNWVMSFGLSSTGKLMHKKHVNGLVTTASTTAPTVGVWHELEVHVTTTGASSGVEVWLDGIQVQALTKTFDLGTAGIGNIQIGDSTTGRKYDVGFDDVAVDESAIPATSPSPTTTVTPSPTTSPSPSPAEPATHTGLVGIGTNADADGTRLNKLTAFEAAVGAQVGVFRLYEDLEADTLTADDVALAERARAVSISLDVPTGSSWLSVTRGSWDAQLRRWAGELRSLAQSGVSLYLIALTHEPENGPTNRGTAAQYVAASRYYVSFMRAENVPARFVFAPMLFNFAVKMSSWYPGNGYIDVLAPDGYNWNGPEACDGGKTFAGMFRQVVDAAQARGKLWGVSEFGSTHRSAAPLHQAQWLAAAGSFIDAHRARLGYVSYWYNDARCDWTFHRAEAFAAFGGMVDG